MIRLIDSKNDQRCNRWRIFGLFGTLSVALLAPACGENTERVISKIPVTYVMTNGGGSGGGATSATSGGSPSAGGALGGGPATGGTPQAQNSGGSSSTAGASSLPPLQAIGAPIGFAALGSGGTTGGGSRVPDIAADCSDLQGLLQDATARVILVKGTFDCTLPSTQVTTCELSCDSTTGDTTGRIIHRVIDSTATDCSGIDGGSATTPMDPRTWTTNERKITVNSNKTLLGATLNATLSGASLYIGPTISNVIIQNLVLTNVNPKLVEAGDAITIDGAHHVWVDHCTFSMISDGFIDTPSPSSSTTSATNITASWNHFDGNNPYSCSNQHNYANTIENAVITFHHNFWDTTLSTSPKITKSAAKVHLFNNYWLTVKYYSIGIDKLAQVLIENNDFNGSNRPYWGLNQCVDKLNCGISDSAGSNLFEGISADAAESKNTGGVALVGLPPSAYTLDSTQLEPASNVKDDVSQNAGPTLTIQ